MKKNLFLKFISITIAILFAVLFVAKFGGEAILNTNSIVARPFVS